MDVYLPIAAVSLNGFVLLILGTAVGFLSGVFGIGGGFLLTPLLILAGVPQAVAVATSANQLVGASVSGALAHWRRGNVDIAMALVMLTGGLAGSAFGVSVFALLLRIGQADLVISLSYAVLLGGLGIAMLFESARTILLRRGGGPVERKLHQHNWMHGLPFKMRFRRSKLYISMLVPLGLGFLVGTLSAIMGVGGGFVMVPAMIYLLGMPTSMVPGTSLFQIIFVSAAVTVLQAVENGTVDLVLAMILLIGGVIGAQLGSRFGAKLRGEQLRAALAIIVLAVAVKLLADMTVTPPQLYTLEAIQ